MVRSSAASDVYKRQIYYVFDEPVFVRRHANGKLPAVRAAKAIAKSLKQYYAQKLPAVDVTCNSFGVFRVPRPDNIEYFEPKMTVDFQALMTWSINFANDKHQIKSQTCLLYTSPSPRDV